MKYMKQFTVHHCLNYRQFMCYCLGVLLILMQSAVYAQVGGSTNNNAGSSLGIQGQVVTPSSPNYNSTDSISTNDEVQWTNYFQSKLGSPFTSVGIIDLPLNFKWVNGKVKLPPKTTLEYEVAGVFITTEPVSGVVVSRLRWTMEPMIQIKIQPPPAAAINFQGTGDGYRVIPYADKLFVVNHHIGSNYLNCRLAKDGSVCPQFATGGKSISPILGQAANPNVYPEFITPNRSIEHVDHTTGNMYVYGAVGQRISVLCVNLDTILSCANEVVMATTSNVNDFNQYAVNPIGSVGSKYYAIVSSRDYPLTQDGRILCYDTSTKLQCPGSPYNPNWGGQNSTVPSYIDVASARLYVAGQDPTNGGRLKCFNTITNGPCNGWSFNSIGNLSDLYIRAGSIFPYLNPNGTFKGICTAQINYTPGMVECRDANNNPFAPSWNYANYLPSSGFMPSVDDPWWWHGAWSNMTTWGTKAFQSDSWRNQNYINCFDFATDSRCFSLNEPNTAVQPWTYSVIVDQVRPYCLWAVGDRALAKSFDPRTGADCPKQTVFPPTLTLDVAPGAYYNCDGSKSNITKWGKVRFSPALPWGTGTTGLTGVAAKIMDSTGTILPIALTPNRNFINGTYELDISDIPYSTYPRLKIELTFIANNATITADVGFDVTWDGEPIQLCFNTIAPVLDNCQVAVKTNLNNQQVHIPAAAPETLNAGNSLVPGMKDEGFGPSVETTTLRQYPKGSSNPTQIMQTFYDFNTFKGGLNQYELMPDLSISTTPVAKTLGATASEFGLIRTSNITTTTIVPFLYTNLTAAQRIMLNRTLTGLVDIKGSLRFNYLMGDKTNEPAIFRSRTGLFAPVVDSSPVTLMKSPIVGYSESVYPGYPLFRKSTLRNNTMVYYQGNDGFLHAYKLNSTSNLIEPAFSFLPSTILDKAVRYSDSTLGQIRKDPYWLDNTVAIADAHLGDIKTTTNLWKTVLVGNQGRGGRSIYALDITTGNADDLLFEYDNTMHTDFNDLGYLMAQPPSDKITGADQIVRVKDGTNERWAYITGNGYDSNKEITNSGTGKAVLYILYLNAKSTTTGVKWRRIPVNSGAFDPVLDVNNGLSNPRPIDTDGDGNVDLVYAGDKQGNLWRFDITNAAAPVVTKIFKTSTGQPIYTAPVAVQSEKALKDLSCADPKKCWLVTFGTGELYNRLTGTNPTNTTTQSFYGLYDMGDVGTPGLILPTQMVLKTLNNTQTATSIRTIAGTAMVYGPAKTDKRGWTVNLTAAEHTSTNPVLLNNRTMLFATTRPSGASNASCAPAAGWLTQINLEDGTSNKSSTSTISLTGNIDVLPPKDRDGLTSGIFLPDTKGTITEGSAPKPPCPVGTVCYDAPTMLGRMSWREVFGLPK